MAGDPAGPAIPAFSGLPVPVQYPFTQRLLKGDRNYVLKRQANLISNLLELVQQQEGRHPYAECA